MTVPAKIFLEIGEKVKNVAQIPLLRRDGNRLFVCCGIAFVVEGVWELYEVTNEIRSVGKFSYEEGSQIRSFPDSKVPLFFISYRSRIDVYSTLDNDPRKLYSLFLPSFEDFMFSGSNLVLTTKETTRVYPFQINSKNGLEFEDYEEHFFTGKLSSNKNTFYITNSRDTYKIFETGHVEKLSRGTLFSDGDMSLIEKEKIILLRRSKYKDLEIASSSRVMKILDEWCILESSGEVTLLNLNTLKEITLPEKGEVFYSERFLFISTDEGNLYVYHLFLSGNIEELARSKQSYKSFEPIPSKSYLTFNRPINPNVELMPRYMMEWDNGQTPYYWPHIVFDEVE